jgi:putative lipoic acid-binding regulatory protein
MPKRSDLPTNPEDLAAELAKLPPAKRYEQLIDFPTDHLFKIIGSAEQAFADAVRATLADVGYPEPALTARFSSSQRYVSVSFTLRVDTGACLVELYERLAAIPGAQYVL